MPEDMGFSFNVREAVFLFSPAQVDLGHDKHYRLDVSGTVESIVDKSIVGASVHGAIWAGTDERIEEIRNEAGLGHAKVNARAREILVVIFYLTYLPVPKSGHFDMVEYTGTLTAICHTPS